MSFSYFDNDKKLQKIDIQVGAKWSDYKTSNEKIDSIFNEVDDGDGIVQLSEKSMLDSLIKQADNQIEATANNNILENDELEQFDIKTATLQQTFDKNNFTFEAIKSAYPEDRYTYTKDKDETTITDKQTGKLVARYVEIHEESRDIVFIDEYTNNDKRYRLVGNQRDNTFSFERTAANNVMKRDFSLKFDAEQLTSYENGDLRLYGQTAILQNILFNNLDNPDWLKNDAIKFIDNISAKDLLEVVKKYNEQTNGGYLLEKLNDSKDIPKKLKDEFIARTLKRLEEAAGYDHNMNVENSQVSTDFYKSENAYNISYSDDVITIQQTQGKGKKKKYTIDLNKLISNLPLDMRPLTKAAIQKLPAEALMDLAIEADKFDSPENYTQTTKNQAGLFDPNKDMISFGYRNLSTITPGTIAHELGHAIDCRNVKNGKVYSTKDNAGFVTAYNNAIKAWNASGKYSDRLYLFTSPQEAFAELYAFSMLGYSEASSANAPTPELVNEFQKQLEAIRALKDDDRHARQK